ncbi:hypothetical protein COB57_02325 [Candidatus Peregrinibacteria bacterium]|nr:MAG: hypothetical protein COB57_02325 [Candidatus Peregrinibacteria bacterium]
MQASIVIPSYNDAENIILCLNALKAQKTQTSFEVIIIDDGSTDNTKESIDEWKKQNVNFPVQYIWQKNQKQGVARNTGVKQATGKILLFIGSDILVHEDWLEQHLSLHKAFDNEKTIAIGLTDWTEELKKDAFRQFLDTSGTQFSYKKLKNYKETDFWHFYTSNISMHKEFFTQFWFDEDFKHYGWEDIMLGYEMSKQGAKIYFAAKAIAQHRHPLTEQDFFPDRITSIGKTAVIFQQKYPEVPVLPTGIKKIIFQILALPGVHIILSLFSKNLGWYAKMKKYYLKGIAEQQSQL